MEISTGSVTKLEASLRKGSRMHFENAAAADVVQDLLFSSSSAVGCAQEKIMKLKLRVAFPVVLVVLIGIAAPTHALEFGGSRAEGHDRYVPPLTNPIFNETPYITTEVRPFYMFQEISSDLGTNGGEINLFAIQLRLALTERFGLIATKDGYADIHFDEGLQDEDGFANLAFGVKYAAYSSPESDSIISVGVEYEAPSGNLKTGGIDLQGDGDGFFDLFATGATVVGPVGLQGSFGFNLAVDDDHNSSLFHFSAHADVEATPWLFPIVELNGLAVVDDGDRTAIDLEGNDLVNLGATDSGTVVTIGGGLRFVLSDHIILGVGAETPVTNDEGLMDWRLTTDAVIHL